MTMEYQQDVRTVAQWNRYRDHVNELMLDPRIATSAGRLFLMKRLTHAQFNAATRWAEMLDLYDVLILGKRRVAKSQSFERSSPGESPEKWGEQERVEEFLRHFRSAHAALLVAGKISEVGVNRLCRDEGVGAYFDDIARGLDALAAHWGLTGKTKNAKRDK